VTPFELPPFAILAVAVALVSYLLVRLKVNAFVALIGAAVVVGMLSPKIPLSEVMRETAARFGSVVGSIGIAIAMAAIVGECLTESGAADRIVRFFLRGFGEKRASLALLASGYVLGVPVFFDTVFYLLVPLARALSARLGGRDYVLLVLAISAGGSATHVFVPPTPGPLAVAAALDVDMGLVMLVGLAVALPASLLAWVYSVWIDRRLQVPLRDAPGGSMEKLSEIAARSESELPSLFPSLLPIAVPVLLISAATVSKSLGATGPFASALGFLGDPTFSLCLAAGAALAVLGSRRGFASAPAAIEAAVRSAGVIILITAAGGAFGGMLVKAGVGDALREWSGRVGLSPLLLGFLLASLFKLAQGSGTVAMITAASILGPLVAQAPPPYHAVYLVTAVGAGSLFGQWMNDSGFWVFRTMTGLTEVETLKAKSGMMAVLAVAGFGMTVLLAWLFPLL
jgi:GntP family gluconate:H+ symporter